MKKNPRIIIYIYNIKYKRHRTATTASHAYTYVYFSGLQAGEETRVSKKREKNIIRHQIKADANLSRSSTAIDRFYTAVTLARRPQSGALSQYNATPHRAAVDDRSEPDVPTESKDRALGASSVPCTNPFTRSCRVPTYLL